MMRTSRGPTEPFAGRAGLQGWSKDLSPDDIKAIVRARAGDVRAFEQLLRAIEPQLRGYLNRLLGGRPIAEDVLQETFLRLWRGLGWLRDPSLLRPWAYRIATNEANRALGRESVRE